MPNPSAHAPEQLNPTDVPPAGLCRVTSQWVWPLFGTAGARALEQAALSSQPTPPLMERAGQSVARLARALAPHARRVWIVCGPGNNGGDGAVAARHLHQAGLDVHVTALPPSSDHPYPADAQMAWQQLADCGLTVHSTPPVTWDLAIDALLGLGGRPGLTGPMAEWLRRMNQAHAPVLCIDTPSGLDSQSGTWHGPPERGTDRRYTLSLLTLKPGLFTQEGRDWAGEVWSDDLGVPWAPHSPGTPTEPIIPDGLVPDAELLATPDRPVSAHASHKGHFGDLAVVGGDVGMEGAAWLAGSAALHAGAGRVWVCLVGRPSPIDSQHSHEFPATEVGSSARHPRDRSVTMPQPHALMTRSVDLLDANATHVVCGCGGGVAVRTVLPRLLSRARSLVLDADALNAIAQDPSLQRLLIRRGASGRPTVLTPHPLEAARLLGCSAREVQADRLGHAQQLARRFGAVIVLKGSGTVIAAAERIPGINPSGNARLASAGTGDVLAGMIGARLAQGDDAWQAATRAVFWHGQAADQWPPEHPLVADRLAEISPGRQTASGSP
jgi:hydroxyethylthiazole kinase-like uncharacterized protein yjeF